MMPLTTPMKLGIGAAVAVVVVIILAVVLSPKPTPDSTPTLPAGITNGMVVRCPTTGAISMVKDGKLSHYATWAVYAAAGKPAFVDVSCDLLASIPKGPDM